MFWLFRYQDVIIIIYVTCQVLNVRYIVKKNLRGDVELIIDQTLVFTSFIAFSLTCMLV